MLGLKKKPEVYPTETRQWVDTERSWGGRPSDKQIDGLKNVGVMTLVHLSETGEPVVADRERVTARGLYYMPMAFKMDRVDADQANAILDLLLGRQNGPFYVYDDDNGKMASVMTLLFKAIPNFWKFDRYEAEAARREIALDTTPQLEASIKAYMRRYVRGRR